MCVNLCQLYETFTSGVYKQDRYAIYIDIKDIRDLYTVRADDTCLELGSSVTLTDLQEICSKYENKQGFQYLRQIRVYMETVANTPVRNVSISCIRPHKKCYVISFYRFTFLHTHF